MKKRTPNMLTVREVAERLEVGQSSVRLWAKDGRFPGAQLEESPAGSYWLIPDTALDGFSKQKPGPKPIAKKGKEK
jgi:excisionase family DNA binding protein